MWAQPQRALFLCLLTTSCSFVSSSFIKRTSEPANTLAACNRLQGLLGNTIVESSAGPDYNATVNSPRNLFNTEFLPTCVILVTEAADVQVAMKTIFEYEVDYAVLAGGHSANTGWDAVNGGVLISFERMTQVSYDATRDTITLQPGARWGPSAIALAPQGVAPVGGRVDDVGTGLLLGGGLSFLSPGHGFASDNYVELDVVLVDGTLVTATANNQYADLFRALKGGANRFGIVTRYEVKAIHTGTPDEKTWFGGSVTYPESSFEALARAISHFVLNDNPNAVHLSIYERIKIEDLDTTIATSWLFYNGNELPDSVFGEFLSIPTLTSNLTSSSYLDVALALAGSSTPGQGVAWGSTALVGNELVDDLYLETVRLWLNFSNTFVSQVPLSVVAFTPVTLSQISYGRERGGNAIDPPLVGYNAILQAINLPEGQKTVPKDVEEGRQSLLQQLPTSPGIPLYVNECDSEQEVFATYGGFEFLKSTYAKYDPTRFNIRHMDGPKGL